MQLNVSPLGFKGRVQIGNSLARRTEIAECISKMPKTIQKKFIKGLNKTAKEISHNTSEFADLFIDMNDELLSKDKLQDITTVLLEVKEVANPRASRPLGYSISSFSEKQKNLKGSELRKTLARMFKSLKETTYARTAEKHFYSKYDTNEEVKNIFNKLI